MLGGADLASLLLPRLPRRHEDDLVECEPIGDLAGGNQVTVVDGIEGSTHHPKSASLRLHELPAYWSDPGEAATVVAHSRARTTSVSAPTRRER
ncbi:Uncharacterised protein [Mycobacteroides abscessus subsp. abscessus]|nr:Uncharacterised protein [Mycobacteroides abscessus subsp. abscessus]